jgi:hypothetical protein
MVCCSLSSLPPILWACLPASCVHI